MTKEKAIELAVDALKKARHPYAVRSSGSSMLFEFGINAKKHYDKYTQAIEIIQKKGNMNSTTTISTVA